MRHTIADIFRSVFTNRSSIAHLIGESWISKPQPRNSWCRPNWDVRRGGSSVRTSGCSGRS